MEKLVFPSDRDELRRWLEERAGPRLPGLLGMQIVELELGRCVMRLDVDLRHQAPNGYLHAGTLVAMADTAAGFGCLASLPAGGTGFTTIELKSNHTGTVLEGGVEAVATMAHGGRTTQVWDVTMTAEATGRTLALFRCTELIVY
ncbi:MAG: PaaI family thioesterase [Acidimicrobiia bacterium]